MQRLLAPLLVSLFLLFGCNAPEDPVYETRLTILSPWEFANEDRTMPILTSLESPLELSYLLSNAALPAMEDRIGNARFALWLNGVEVTDKQQPNNPDGFTVSNVGNGGRVYFGNLQPLESALITGENKLVLVSLNDPEDSADVEFIFFGQSPQVVVDRISTLQDDDSSITVNGSYLVHLSVLGETPLNNLGHDEGLGKDRYDIKFWNRAGQQLNDANADVSADGRKITLRLTDFPDVSTGPIQKADFRYEFTDALGKTHKKGFVMNGSELNEVLGLQINNSAFKAFNPILSQMFSSIVREFVPLLEDIVPAKPLDNLMGDDVVLGGAILAPAPFDGTETFIAEACNTFLTKASAANKRCAFYAEIVQDPFPMPEISVGFHKVEDGNDPDHGKPKLHFDLIFDKLQIKIKLVAYDMIEENVANNGYVTFNRGTYLGGFNTTIVFEDVAMRDTLGLGTKTTPYQQCKQANPASSCSDVALQTYAGEMMKGLTTSEGYSLIYNNEIAQKIADILYGDDTSNYNPQLNNSTCPGNICVIDPIHVEALSNFGGVAVRVGLIEAIEAQLNQFLPDIVKSIVYNFPDINGLRKITTDNKPEQVVSSVVDVNSLEVKDQIRKLAVENIGVKNLNPFSFFGVGTNYSGLMRFSGGFKTLDQESGMLSSQQYLTSFVTSTNYYDLNHFNWGKDVNVAYVDSVTGEDKSRKHQVDAVLSLGVNAINQYLASEFQMKKAEGAADWLSYVFSPVNTNSDDRTLQSMSLVVSQFNNFIKDGVDDAELVFAHTRPPEITFVGGKDSKWKYAYDLLFGFVKGEVYDERILPAVKIAFNEVDIKLYKGDRFGRERVFEVNANVSIEAHITFKDGLPKLYVRPPKDDKAIEEPLNKRLVFDINHVDYLNPAAINNADLLAIIGGGEIAPGDSTNPELKVQISSAFVGSYQNQISRYVDGISEELFEPIVADMLRDHFSSEINFNDYGCDGWDDRTKFYDPEKDLRITIIDPDPNEYGEANERKKFLHELFGASDPVLIQANLKWFTTDQSAAWLNMGVDFTHSYQDGECPTVLPPMSICFTVESLGGAEAACENN